MAKVDKKKQPVFDVIQQVDRLNDQTGTVWRGEKGTYIFKHTGNRTRHKPVAHVLLNSKYLTGLFATDKKGIFSGDIKTSTGKVYLLFVVHDHDGNIEIVQKSTPKHA